MPQVHNETINGHTLKIRVDRYGTHYASWGSCAVPGEFVSADAAIAEGRKFAHSRPEVATVVETNNPMRLQDNLWHTFERPFIAHSRGRIQCTSGRSYYQAFVVWHCEPVVRGGKKYIEIISSEEFHDEAAFQAAIDRASAGL